jgi:hypothetical protein
MMAKAIHGILRYLMGKHKIHMVWEMVMNKSEKAKWEERKEKKRLAVGKMVGREMILFLMITWRQNDVWRSVRKKEIEMNDGQIETKEFYRARMVRCERGRNGYGNSTALVWCVASAGENRIQFWPMKTHVYWWYMRR